MTKVMFTFAFVVAAGRAIGGIAQQSGDEPRRSTGDTRTPIEASIESETQAAEAPAKAITQPDASPNPEAARSAAITSAAAQAWRYRQFNDRWFYWMPGNFWMQFNNGAWSRLDPGIDAALIAELGAAPTVDIPFLQSNGDFWTLSPDGRWMFFRDGNWYTMARARAATPDEAAAAARASEAIENQRRNAGMSAATRGASDRSAERVASTLRVAPDFSIGAQIQANRRRNAAVRGESPAGGAAPFRAAFRAGATPVIGPGADGLIDTGPLDPSTPGAQGTRRAAALDAESDAALIDRGQSSATAESDASAAARIPAAGFNTRPGVPATQPRLPATRRMPGRDSSLRRAEAGFRGDDINTKTDAAAAAGVPETTNPRASAPSADR